MSPRHIIALATLVGLYLFGSGFVGGVITERMRFDAARSTRLAELGAATSRVRAHLMLLEKDSAGPVALRAAR